jgi:hypothetical protein
MLFEPLVAASAIAFSVNALWISLAVIAAFLIRQPLKVLLITRNAGRTMPQTAAARKFLLYYSIAFAVGTVGALAGSHYNILAPLIIAGPLALVPVYFDSIGKSRNLAPEIAGTVAITSSAAVIALAGGWSLAAASVLWLLLMCRWIPSILYVRTRLLLEKGKPFTVAVPITLSALGMIISAALAFYGIAPALPAAVMAILFVRASIGLSPYSRRCKAQQIGILEVGFGVTTVLSLILGYHLHI